jgi:integral membrane protein
MSTQNLFTKVAIAEGISYILLLFVAMPFKYYADMPLGVKYVGWAHGILFIAYYALLIMLWQEKRFKFKTFLLLAMAALLPFAPFFVDKYLNGYKVKN